MNTNEILRLILNLVRKGQILAVDHDKALCRVSSGELQTNWIKWLSLAAGETRDWNPPTVGEQVLLLCPGGELADGIALRGIYTDDITAPSQSPTTHTRTYPDGAVIEYDHASHGLTATFPEGATVLLIAPSSVTIHTTVATIEADSVLVKSDDVKVEASSVVVQADTVIIDAPTTTCTGNLIVQKTLSYMGGMLGAGSAVGAGGKAAVIQGELQATGDIKAGNISLTEHKHTEQGDGNATSAPI